MKTYRLYLFPLLLLATISFGTGASPANAQEQAQVDGVQAKVAALPDEGAAGQVKAMLTVALERVKSCSEAGDEADATALLADIEAALTKNPGSLAAASTETKSLIVLTPPKVVEGNPYLQRLMAGATAQLAQPDKPWAKNTPEVNIFNGLGGGTGSRSTGEEMQAWLWLFASPASPMKGRPDVLARYLRLANAYADALDVHGTEEMAQEVSKINDSGPKAGRGIFDDFAIAPAADALREFAQLQPGLLLPAQKAQWDRAMTNGGRVMFGKAKDRPGEYANIDITLGFELLSFGLYLNNQEYLDKAKFLVEAQSKNIYPDGAIAYIGHENESCTYHDADVHYLSRYYLGSGDEKVLDLLRQTEWYGPVSDARLCEFWTTPSWKDTWNSDRVFCGGEEVASITGNPYLREMCDEVLALPVDPRGWAQNYAPLIWYRNDIKPKPLPDNYTVLDRNIEGPRAWYGRFNYACTTRATPDTEAGLRTMMGAQMTSPDGHHLGQIAMDIYPRVRMKPEELNPDGTFNRAAFAWRTADLKSALVLGRSFSAVAGKYVLQEYRSSSAGNKVDWNGRQLWLGLSDRVIGLVEVAAAGDGAKAIDVEGVVRLGTGGTVNGPPTKIEDLGGNSWKYGDLTASVLAHNYASIQTPEVPFREPKFPTTEIRLLDEKAAGAKTVSEYPASTRLFYLLEIRSSTATEPAKASVVESTPGLQEVDVTVGTRHFLVAANLTDGDISYTLPGGFEDAHATIHDSTGSVNRPTSGGQTLKSMEMQVAVNSPDAEDQLPGWADFQDMLAGLGQK